MPYILSAFSPMNPIASTTLQPFEVSTGPAVVPGSFDPLTLGHYDLIARASTVFPTLIVAVLDHPTKQKLFSVDERVAFLTEIFAPFPSIQVRTFQGLLVDFLSSVGSHVIVRGLRGVSDYEYECNMAMINNRLTPHVETVFLSARENRMFVSSTIVKQIAFLHGDVSPFVPDIIREALVAKVASLQSPDPRA
jgi:pantetheine-phosphate adenylyltransferase